MEHILQENKDRFVMFPLKYHDIWEMYKTQQHSFWTAEEIDLAQDLTDWNEKLNDNEIVQSHEDIRSLYENEKRQYESSYEREKERIIIHFCLNLERPKRNVKKKLLFTL